MANVAMKKLLSRNFFAIKEFQRISTHSRCTSIFVINFNCNNGTFSRRSQLDLKPLQGCITSRIQAFSQHCEDKDKVKLSLFQRFKQMYKDYWYVLLPVHVVTSVAWFGGFYYLAKSGVDIVAILESLNISEKLTNPLKDSSMGYLALAYALYKIATPARYTVTLGGTTISINYLKKWGYIRPVPSRERLKEMYLERKDNLFETMRETKEGFKMQSEKLKDKKENIIEDLDKSIKQLGVKIKSEEHLEIKEKTPKYKPKD